MIFYSFGLCFRVGVLKVAVLIDTVQRMMLLRLLRHYSMASSSSDYSDYFYYYLISFSLSIFRV